LGRVTFSQKDFGLNKELGERLLEFAPSLAMRGNENFWAIRAGNKMDGSGSSFAALRSLPFDF
jgi:hypothetical protein